MRTCSGSNTAENPKLYETAGYCRLGKDFQLGRGEALAPQSIVVHGMWDGHVFSLKLRDASNLLGVLAALSLSSGKSGRLLSSKPYSFSTRSLALFLPFA